MCSVGELAVRLGVSRSELDAMTSAGKIMAIRTDFDRTIPIGEVERFRRH